MEDDDTPDTRVFVTGLPPNFSSNQLGAHFAGRYQITDAVVVPDRRIGFVGFRNYTLAKSAINYFDKTYIRMSKISVEMAKPVEIQRTATSQGIPISRHSKKWDAPRPSPTDPVSVNGHTATTNHAGHNSAFQPYTPVVTSNKRKREPQNKLPQESLDASLAVSTTNTTPGQKIDVGNSAPEAEDQDMKKARRKEKKQRKEHKSQADQSHRDEDGQAGSDAADPETRSKKKKRKEGALDSRGADFAPRMTEDSANGVEVLQSAEKKTKRNKKDGGNDQQGNRSVSQPETLKKGQNHSSQVDDDIKGGVDSLDDGVSGLTGQSADQREQRRQNPNVTSDNDWLRAKTSRVLDLVDSDLEDDIPVPTKFEERSNEPAVAREDEKTEELSTSPAPRQVTSNENDLSSTGRLFVRNLPYTANELEIEKLFSKYGDLKEVHLVRDKTGSSKGISYILFADPNGAKHALEGLDGKSFQGRLLHILEAAERKSQKLDDYEISKLPLKKQKALKRKKEASGSTFKWNSMYMNPNAVLASVADRLGVAKADLIDASSSDAAVKQAHAEAHVIQETKAFLASNGVKLEAFKQHERDEETLLVKNFPFGTSAEELKSLFGAYGKIVKCLIPPTGTIAIIQYAQPGEGSQAMRQLAYRNLNGSVLYLERAPKNLFDHSARFISDRKSSDEPPLAAKEAHDSSKAAESSSSSTLFVRNLSFTTTTSGLANAFRPLSGFLSARVKTKVDPKRPRELLSMGFGFVEFSSDQHAQAALAALNGHRLDNHELLVQISRKSTDAAEEQRHKDSLKKSEAHKTKIIIKNLPFEATKKDVRALLSAYGQLRSVKVPQKFDHSTRGFAFADFVTAKEAETTMEALQDTHLLGRRLVLQYAEEESIDPEDEIRAIESKVERQTEMVQLKKMTGTARKRFNVGTEGDPESL